MRAPRKPAPCRAEGEGCISVKKREGGRGKGERGKAETKKDENQKEGEAKGWMAGRQSGDAMKEGQ